MKSKLKYYNDVIDITMIGLQTGVVFENTRVVLEGVREFVKEIYLTWEDVDRLDRLYNVLSSNFDIKVFSSKPSPMNIEFRLLDQEEIEQLTEDQVKWLELWKQGHGRDLLTALKFIGFYDPNIFFAIPLHHLGHLVRYMKLMQHQSNFDNIPSY